MKFFVTGVEIVKRALRVPCMQIAKNAGVDGSLVVAKVESQSGDYGYDALNNEYVNMFERGIIDPTKVIFLHNVEIFLCSAQIRTRLMFHLIWRRNCARLMSLSTGT